MLSRDRFFRGSSSVVSVSSAACADVDLDLLGSSVDGGSREDVRMGSRELAFVVELSRDDVDPEPLACPEKELASLVRPFSAAGIRPD